MIYKSVKILIWLIPRSVNIDCRNEYCIFLKNQRNLVKKSSMIEQIYTKLCVFEEKTALKTSIFWQILDAFVEPCLTKKKVKIKHTFGIANFRPIYVARNFFHILWMSILHCFIFTVWATPFEIIKTPCERFTQICSRGMWHSNGL